MPANTSSHETTGADKDTKYSPKSDISHVLSNCSAAHKAGQGNSSSVCGQCCLYNLQLRVYSYPRALVLHLSCWLTLWPRGLLACQPVVSILHSNVAQNLCMFTETKSKTEQQDSEGLPGLPFPCVAPTSPLVRENTGQVTSHTSCGRWWHQCPGGAARSFPADMSLQWNPASNDRKSSVTLIVTLS